MNRKQFLEICALNVLAAACRGLPLNNSKKLPNIMLILADDMHWQDCQPYGSPNVITPNMTRLAEQGMCFDNMFTGTAMCAPSRNQLFTGLYPVRNGSFPNHSWCYNDVKSFCTYFRELGYRISAAGKFGSGPPDSFKVDQRFGALNIRPYFEGIEKFVNQNKKQPFFTVIGSKQPHRPWNTGKQSEYKKEDLIVPPYLADCPHTRKELVEYYAEITYLDRQVGKCIDIIDRSGQKDNTILIFTSEQGCSLPYGGKWTCYDNGLKTAFIVRWPEKIKPGTRNSAMTHYVDVIPTLLEAAGVDPMTIDTDMPDAQGNVKFDGQSFYKTLVRQTDQHRKFVYGIHTTRNIVRGNKCYPIRSVRSEQYKYIENLKHEEAFSCGLMDPGRGVIKAWQTMGETDAKIKQRIDFFINRPPIELYDIKKDPYEMHNLADEESLAGVKAGLKKELKQWMDQQGDMGIETELKATSRKSKEIKERLSENVSPLKK